MKIRKQPGLWFGIFILLACNREGDLLQQEKKLPEVIEFTGYVVPVDSIAESKVVSIDTKKLKQIPAGDPAVLMTLDNVHPAGIPKIVKAGNPKVRTPGKDTFSLPKIIAARGREFPADEPGTFTAPENNPGTLRTPMVLFALDSSEFKVPKYFTSFAAFKSLNGQKIHRMIQDKRGNLWFGMIDRGVIRYDGKTFSNYTEREGLPDYTIQAMAEDDHENLWFGTDNGMVKFDGKSFTHYKDIAGPKSNVVLSILKDRRGDLWFATLNGLIKYDGKSFICYTSEEGLPGNAVYSLVEDDIGNIWCGTFDYGVVKFDGRSFSNYTVNEGLQANVAIPYLKDKQGNIWFCTSTGVSRYDGKYFMHYSGKEGLPGNVSLSIEQDQDGNFWFGTDEGVAKFDGKQFTHYTVENGLPGNIILLIFEDHCGNLWFSKYGGDVSLYSHDNFWLVTEKDGIHNQSIKSIFQDDNGVLWFATNVKGVLKFDGKSLVHYPMNEELPDNRVSTMAQDNQGNIWFGTRNGAAKFDGKKFTLYTNNDGLPGNNIISIVRDINGFLWIACDSGVAKYDGKSFTIFNTSTGLHSNSMGTIVTDKRNGNLWFASSKGLTMYDGVSFVQYDVNRRISDSTISSVTLDINDNLWFGTFNGLYMLDGKHLTHFTEKEGMPAKIVYAVQADRKGNIWFATPEGLSVLPVKQQDEIQSDHRVNTAEVRYPLIKNYSDEDGFVSSGFAKQSLLVDKNGTIWIAATDRLTAYHPPAKGILADTLAPNIQITGIELFNESIRWSALENKKDSTIVLRDGTKIRKWRFDSVARWYNLPENLSLAYDNNYVTFKFTGITLKNPKSVRYRFKLEGFDEKWSAVTDRCECTYPNLSHGSYTFKVMARNGDGYWSGETNYKFTIRPPWWKTWWAYGTYLLIIFWITWYYIKYRERAYLKRQKELETMIQLRTSELIDEKKKLEKQKERSDELLLNILPSEVAEELKLTGHCQAKTFSMVTVMFTDFKDFSSISEKISAELLVDEINHCFSEFDKIIQKYKVEKIKTVGDAYLCASGLPVLNYTHAKEIVNAAIEIRDYMLFRKREKEEKGEVSFELRIGIHTGPVVAGIVGVKKFQYDIWGDTVNIASRMESSGEAGKVNISEKTYELVKDLFHCTYRGKIHAKHKGEIDMYFVERSISGIL
jgi:ligand-binding sensor domain-containing protein/class 3 adenylate cyclase